MDGLEVTYNELLKFKRGRHSYDVELLAPNGGGGVCTIDLRPGLLLEVLAVKRQATIYGPRVAVETEHQGAAVYLEIRPQDVGRGLRILNRAAV